MAETVQIKNPTELLQKLLSIDKASGGSLTIKSLRTGKDYTYRITRHVYNKKNYTTVYIEYGYMRWGRLGNYFKGSIWLQGKKDSTDSAKGIAFLLSKAEAGEDVSQYAILYHQGACFKCGRPLTDALSIETGLGPICRK